MTLVPLSQRIATGFGLFSEPEDSPINGPLPNEDRKHLEDICHTTLDQQKSVIDELIAGSYCTLGIPWSKDYIVDWVMVAKDDLKERLGRITDKNSASAIKFIKTLPEHHREEASDYWIALSKNAISVLDSQVEVAVSAIIEFLTELHKIDGLIDKPA